MSLINQMLKDLERRARRPAGPEITLSGLLNTESIEITQNRHMPLLITVITLLSLTFIGLLVYKGFYFKLSNSMINSHIPSTHIVVNNADEKRFDAIINTPINSSILTGITLQSQQNMSYLRFLLNQETFYRVSMDAARHTLHIVLSNTTLVADMPSVNYLKSGIKDMTMSNDTDGNLKLDIMLEDNADINRIDAVIANNNTSELQLDVLLNKKTSAIAVPATKQNFFKKSVDAFNSEAVYHKALNYFYAGQNMQAMDLLINLLDTHPEFRQARELLAKLYIQEHQIVKAKKLLQTGLELDSNYLPFVEMQARLLVGDGKSARALELLQQAAPPIEKNPEYHAFIAALYQRLGNNLLAEKLYQQLLVLRPSKAVWWLGLGVALESQGNITEAKGAYLRADNTRGLSPELKAFVQTRMSDL